MCIRDRVNTNNHDHLHWKDLRFSLCYSYWLAASKKSNLNVMYTQHNHALGFDKLTKHLNRYHKSPVTEKEVYNFPLKVVIIIYVAYSCSVICYTTYGIHKPTSLPYTRPLLNFRKMGAKYSLLTLTTIVFSISLQVVFR